MYPWLFFLAPQLHLFWSGNVARRIEASPNRFNSIFLSLSVFAALGVSHPAKAAIQEIDILVAYTPRALANHDAYFQNRGLDRTLQESLSFSIVMMNHVHRNSGSNARYRIAHFMEQPVDFDEATVEEDPKELLVSKKDGVMDEVHDLRTQYGADMVALIVEGDFWPTWSGGSANTLEENDPSLSEHAPFFLVDWAAIDSSAWPHENGHSMGLHHDWYRGAHKYGKVPTSHSFGYVSPDFTWRTLMAYEDHCLDAARIDCPRVPLFSSPNLVYADGTEMGVPAGTSVACENWNLDNPPCDADAVASLKLTAPTVKGFRSRKVPRLPAPQGLQPQGRVSQGTVTLRWNEVSGATNYEILVGLTNDNASLDAFVYEWLHDQNVLFFSVPVSASNCRSGVCSKDLDLLRGYHYFSVKAYSLTGYSRWADTRSFVVDSPVTDRAHTVTQISPDDGTHYPKGATITVKFKPLPYEVEAYKVSVWDRDDDYTIHSQKYPTNEICSDNTCTVSLPSRSWAKHRYHWKVRADNTPYGDGPFSPKLNFNIDNSDPTVTDDDLTVAPIAPDGTYYLEGATVTVMFSPLPYESEAYNVSVWDRDDEYTIHAQKYPTDEICGSDVCTVSLPSESWATHRYNWKVRVDDTPYGDGPYSSPLKFYIDNTDRTVTAEDLTVTSIAPDGTFYPQGAAVTVMFKPLPYEADAYKVLVWDRDDDYTIHAQKYPVSSICGSNICAVSLPSESWAAHRYHWKVRIDDTLYGDGPYSPKLNFELDSAYTPPTDTDPPDDLTVTPVTPNGADYLRGSTVTVMFEPLPYESEAYKVSVWDRDEDYTIHAQKYPTDEICGSDVCMVSLPSESWATHRYNWKVRVDDTPYGDGPFSPKLNFNIDDAYTTVTDEDLTVTSIAPDDTYYQEGGTVTVVFKPLPYEADAYKVFVWDRDDDYIIHSQKYPVDSICGSDICAVSLPSESWPAHRYNWRVRIDDTAHGDGPYSSKLKFYIQD